MQETEGLDFVAGGRVARRPVPRRARVRGSVAEAATTATAAPRAAALAARGRRALLRALPLGIGRGEQVRAYLAEPRPRRGSLQRVPPRPLARRGRPAAQGAREGLRAGGARGRRPRQQARQRLLLGAG